MSSAIQGPIGDKIDGRYTITRRIADGGMATVYQAMDERLSRTVALKIMHTQLAQGSERERFIKYFRREARSAAQIANAHIVQVYDFGEWNGLDFLVMEYVEGVNLRYEIQRKRHFTIAEMMKTIGETLDGLAAAHREGVVHRDIKPENILINKRGHVQITDFGLAKATSQATLATTGMLLGTAAYLAPEMISDNLATPQGDLYSVGIMAWELISGVTPFQTDNAMTIVFKHVHEDVPSLASAYPDIPKAVSDFVAELTARSVDARPADADKALEKYQQVMSALTEDQLEWHATSEPTAEQLGLHTNPISRLVQPAEAGTANATASPDGTASPEDTDAPLFVTYRPLDADAHGDATAQVAPAADSATELQPSTQMSHLVAINPTTGDISAASAVTGRISAIASAASEADTAEGADGASAPAASSGANSVSGAHAADATDGSPVPPPPATQAPGGSRPGETAGQASTDSPIPSAGSSSKASAQQRRITHGPAAAHPGDTASSAAPTVVLSAPSPVATPDAGQAPADSSTTAASHNATPAQQRQQLASTTRLAPSAAPTAPMPPMATEEAATEILGKHHKKHGTFFKVMIVLLVVVVTAVGGMAWWYFSGPGSYEKLPSASDVACADESTCTVAGADWNSYKESLDSLGIAYQVTERNDDTVSSGKIISTSPSIVGTAVSKRGGIVDVVVSSGPLMVTVPDDLLDPDSDDGKDPLGTLQNAGFDTVIHDESADEYSLTVPEGAAISVDPEPGSTVTHNTQVTVVLSKGPKPVTMPDVVGKTRSDVESYFSTNNITVNWTDDYSNTVDDGVIISATADSGDTLHWGDSITITVSKGPQMQTVPNVVGKSYDDAAATLEALGFKVEKKTTILGNWTDQVRQQSVDANQSVRLYDTNGNPTVITLTVV